MRWRHLARLKISSYYQLSKSAFLLLPPEVIKIKVKSTDQYFTQKQRYLEWTNRLSLHVTTLQWGGKYKAKIIFDNYLNLRNWNPRKTIQLESVVFSFSGNFQDFRTTKFSTLFEHSYTFIQMIMTDLFWKSSSSLLIFSMSTSIHRIS